jgi:hypothetical protein
LAGFPWQEPARDLDCQRDGRESAMSTGHSSVIRLPPRQRHEEVKA